MHTKLFFYVKKNTLLAIAGSVWFLAGMNVAHLGIMAYLQLSSILVQSVFASIVVFCVFGLMFYKTCQKHTKRIQSYPQSTKPAWHFFDLKSYSIMIIMMGGGIWLRTSGLVPVAFVAVFYTGLGSALAFAGILFWNFYLRHQNGS